MLAMLLGEPAVADAQPGSGSAATPPPAAVPAAPAVAPDAPTPAPVAPAANAPRPAAEAAPPVPAATTPAPEHVVRDQPAAVLGQAVRGSDGRNLGRIVDILVDKAGKPLAAVIDFGGFMGLGNRQIAVNWSDLKFDPKSASDPVTLALTLDQLKAAPAYKGAETQVKVIGNPTPPAATQTAPATANTAPAATTTSPAPSKTD